MVVEKKIYDNFEDFEGELRERKPKETFLNYMAKSETGQDRREVSGGKNAKGEDIPDEIVIGGAKTFYIISLAAVINRDEKGRPTTVIYHYDTTNSQFNATKKDATAQADNVKQTMDALVAELQKNHAGLFIRKGTLQIEG
jgi:hypothetical protein